MGRGGIRVPSEGKKLGRPQGEHADTTERRRNEELELQRSEARSRRQEEEMTRTLNLRHKDNSSNFEKNKFKEKLPSFYHEFAVKNLTFSNVADSDVVGDLFDGLNNDDEEDEDAVAGENDNFSDDEEMADTTNTKDCNYTEPIEINILRGKYFNGSVPKWLRRQTHPNSIIAYII